MSIEKCFLNSNLNVLFFVGQLFIFVDTIKITSIENLEYQPWKCDNKDYESLKFSPLIVKFAIQIENVQYLIMNKYIIKRNQQDSRFKFANHSEETKFFYKSLKKNNTVIQFKDDLLTAAMTSDLALKLLNYRYLKTTDVLDMYKFTDQCNLLTNCRNFFFAFKSSPVDKLINFNFLITIQSDKPIIYKKNQTTGVQMILNDVKNSKFPIDSVLFSNFESGQEIIEFSNAHSLIRQYKLPANSETLITMMTYYELLNCFHEVCEGGQYKGLITLKNPMDGKYYRYFFLEDHYLQVDQNQLFESTDNAIAKLKNYKKTYDIKNYPNDELGIPLPLDLNREIYANNFLFPNDLQAFISINKKLYYLTIEDDDLKILTNEEFPYASVLKFRFLTFTSSLYELNQTNIEKISTFTENKIEVYEYKENKIELLKEFSYENLIEKNPNPAILMQLVSITDFSSVNAIISFFSPSITFSYKQPLNELFKFEEKSATIDLSNSKEVTVYEFRFLKCFYDYRRDKLAGILPSRKGLDDPSAPEEYSPAIYFSGISTAVGVVVILLIAICIYGESDSERRERFRNKLFYNKFTRFLRIRKSITKQREKSIKKKPKLKKMDKSYDKDTFIPKVKSEGKKLDAIYLDDTFFPSIKSKSNKLDESSSYLDDTFIPSVKSKGKKSDFHLESTFFPKIKSKSKKLNESVRYINDTLKLSADDDKSDSYFDEKSKFKLMTIYSFRPESSSKFKKSKSKSLSAKSIKSKDLKITKIRALSSSKSVVKVHELSSTKDEQSLSNYWKLPTYKSTSHKSINNNKPSDSGEPFHEAPDFSKF